VSKAAASNITYLGQLGLTRSPFPPTPDAEGYFHTPALERELAEAAHCLLARKGFVLMTGEVGMGKSTFLRRLLDAVEREGAIASVVFNTFLQGPELLAAILRDFGIEAGADAAGNISRLNSFLVRRWQDNTTCVVVIDDAQNLSLESLELLRLLSSLESGQEKLLQIVLAGQPELDEQLGRHEIRQLTSRIVKHIRMQPLDAGESERYVEFRLAVAGASGRIRLTPAAHATLYRRSQGNPRRIHLIMDRCLYGIVARGTAQVDAGLVRMAAAEAGFLPPRKPRPRWQWAAAALLVTTGLATAAGMALRNDAGTPPVLTTHIGNATLASATPDDAGWSACLARLTPPASQSGRTLQIAPVPERHIAALESRTDTCLTRRDQNWLAAWQPRLPADELQTGQRSESVRALQTLLLAHDSVTGRHADEDGPLVDSLLVDGMFGPRTRLALSRFQHRHGLAVTGRPDPLTLLLVDTVSPTPVATPISSPERQHGNG
jgi:general secretion pathway protein A